MVASDKGIIVGVQWASNDRLLITVNMNVQVVGDDMNPWYRALAVDTNGANGALMMNNIPSKDNNYSTADVEDLALDNPGKIYMTMYLLDQHIGLGEYGSYKTVLEVNTDTGWAHPIAKGGKNTRRFIMDGHGDLVARIDRTSSPFADHLLLFKEGDWREIASFDAEGGRGAGIVGLNQTGDAMLRWSAENEGKTLGLVTVPLAGGQGTVVAHDEKYDLNSSLTDPWTDRVIGYSVVADMTEYRYFDPKMQALQKGLEAAFDGYSVHPVSWDGEMRKVVVAVDGPRRPRIYYLLDRTSHEAVPISGTYNGVKTADLGEVKPFPYKARDGLNIPAYLTLPPGKPAKLLPTVIMPHGGPMARDAQGFDWMAQFIASRGYAVLQPNFRGSSGYGKAFLEAGFGQWGLKMQDDITDGVKTLIADGIADPKRICIVGASYGGYAALASAAFTPDLYACAASWAGVADLKQMYMEDANNAGGNSSWAISGWKHFIGDRWEAPEKLDAVSPARHVENIRAPVLLMHGSADATVRIAQSETMERALKRAGKSVRFVTVAGETHYLHLADSRVRWLTELEAFLKAHIGQ